MAASLDAAGFPSRRVIRLGGGARSVWPPIATFVAVVAVWEEATRFFDIPAYLVPSPSRIGEAIFSANGSLFYHTWITGAEAVYGFVLGSILGALLGVGFAYSTFLRKALLPYVIAANTIPIVGIVPIVILWFGNGLGSKIAVTAFLSFFPLSLNMMKGLQSYEPTLMDVFHVGAATPLQRFLKMRLPSSLPYVFVGLKLNVTFAVIGAIVAEFVQADRGLGFVIMTAYKLLNMPRLWAAMVLSAMLGIVFFAVVNLVEKWTIPWHQSVLGP